MGTKIEPIGSMCLMGFIVSLPANRAVGSPRYCAIYPWDTSWATTENTRTAIENIVCMMSTSCMVLVLMIAWRSLNLKHLGVREIKNIWHHQTSANSVIKAPAWLGGIQTACVLPNSTRAVIPVSTPISSGSRFQRRYLGSLVVASRFVHAASRQASIFHSKQNKSFKPQRRFFVIEKCTPWWGAFE